MSMEKFEVDEITYMMKAIPGFEGYYSATRDGRIYRHGRKTVKAGWVKQRDNTVYARVPLYKPGGKREWHHVHRIIAMTFIPNPQYKPQVNHKNCNKHDNRVGNLEWVTWRENWEHARDNGRYRGRMLNDEERAELYQQYLTRRYTYDDLAKMFGISTSSVNRHIVKMKGQPVMQKAA